MKKAYTNKKPTANTLSVINKANEIIEEYEEQGYSLTLRQLYYQFVSRDLIPNSDREYKKLGTAINTGRLVGLINWKSIVDRTRNLKKVSTWDNAGDIIKSAANSFALDLWKTQYRRIEVWIEKDALIGVIENICNKYQVPFFSCRGYPSQSEVWSASRRLLGYMSDGQEPLIIHLGDHDPSGIDMTRDIIDRTEMFTDGGVEVRRIALNMDQIEQYKPPPNPAKITDSRAEGYIDKYGRMSWELDALEPSVMEDLIEENITEFIDQDLWDEEESEQEEQRSRLLRVADTWDD